MDARLNEVATQLEKLPKDDDGKVAAEANEAEEAEKALLKSLESTPKDTPIPSPPKCGPAITIVPSGGVTGGDNGTTIESIDERVESLFGKRPRLSDDIDQSETSSKSVDPIETSNTATPQPQADSTIVNVVNMETESADTQSLTTNNNNVDSNNRMDDSDVGDNSGNVNVGDKSQDPSPVVENPPVAPMEAEANAPAPAAPANNIWPQGDAIDQPEGFPDVGFPMAPPTYPSPPEFHYRYRSGPNSTPRSRRIDFERSIVLRDTRRDPHTGRVSQEDYDAREDSEMALSLG